MLSDRVAFVTGASKGLGEAIAAALAKAGASVALCARNAEELQAAAEKLRAEISSSPDQSGKRVLAVAADVTLEPDVEHAVQRVVEHFGRLDVLVNNAGIFQIAPVTTMPLEHWRKVIDTNLTSAFLCSKFAAARMLEQRGGHIINIASIGGMFGFAKLSAYCASKFGLRGLAKALSLELKPQGIRVTTIFPHNMNSARRQLAPDSPERRQMIEVGDVAAMVAHVATTPDYVDVEEITMFGSATRVTPTFE